MSFGACLQVWATLTMVLLLLPLLLLL